MVAVVLDPELQRSLIRRRRRTGADLYDEVWDGVYVMAPSADIQHQALSSDINTVFQLNIDWAGLGRSMAAVNISDRDTDWKKNFRVPDLAVFLKGNRAVQHRTFWHGGPDFALEITSPVDRTAEKLPFYESVSTRELLIVERKPWQMRLYRLTNGKLELAGTSTPDVPNPLQSSVIPLAFDFRSVDQQIRLLIRSQASAQEWQITPHELPAADNRKQRRRK